MNYFLIWLLFSILNAKFFRKHSKFLQRINDIQWGALVTLDIVIGYIAFNSLYLFGILNDRPFIGETISSFAGRYSFLGRPWAKSLAKIIDSIFLLLANQHDHCAKEAAKHLNLS